MTVDGHNGAASTEKATSTENLLSPPHLPFDLVAEILCRLPVKHLLQLRCICKSWNSLISRDSNFANKHLRLSTSNHERHHLIRITTQSPNELVVCHSPISSVFSSASTTSVTQFTYSLGEILNQKIDFDGASTCDGMVCFKINDSLAALCNPSIRKFKILPPLKCTDQIIADTLYTLVYDRFTNNYKIIALTKTTLTKTLSRKNEVYVHTLGTDYWRTIQDFPAQDPAPSPSSGTFMNDSVNWLIYDYGYPAKFIVSLDLEKEIYQKLSLPVFDARFEPPYMTLGTFTLRGCLSLFFHMWDKFFEIWIMKEYGNEKCWIKLLRVPHIRECGFYAYTRALYISKDDQVLLQFVMNRNFNLVVYDSINNTFKFPKFQNNICYKEMVAPEVYVESLISPL